MSQVLYHSSTHASYHLASCSNGSQCLCSTRAKRSSKQANTRGSITDTACCAQAVRLMNLRGLLCSSSNRSQQANRIYPTQQQQQLESFPACHSIMNEFDTRPLSMWGVCPTASCSRNQHAMCAHLSVVSPHAHMLPARVLQNPKTTCDGHRGFIPSPTALHRDTP